MVFLFNTLLMRMKNLLPIRSAYKKLLFTILLILLAFPLLANTPFIEKLYAAPPNSFVIFGSEYVGDTLAPGWSNPNQFNTSTTVNQTVTNPIYQGVHSFSFQSSAPFDRVEFYTITPFDVSGYQYLNFYARAAQPGLSYGVSFLSNGLETQGHAKLGTQVSMNNYGGTPLTDRWLAYSIPLSAMGNPGQIYGIAFTDLNGGGQQQPMYLDELMFSKTAASPATNPTTIGPNLTPTEPTPIPNSYFPSISPWVFLIPTIIVGLAVMFQ